MASSDSLASSLRDLSQALEGVAILGIHAPKDGAKAGSLLPILDSGLLEPVQGTLAERAVVPDALQFQELVVDLVAELPEVGEVLDALPHPEVSRVVDGGLRSKGVVLLEALLHVGPLVLDVEAGVDAAGDDPRAVSVRWRWCPPGGSRREQEADPAGLAQVQVVPDDLLEEAPALYRMVKDLGQADLHLPQRPPVLVARLEVLRCQRPRQLRRPLLEEALHVAWLELIAHLLKPLRLAAGEEIVVQALEADPLLAELLLDPLVAIQTQFHGVREGT